MKVSCWLALLRFVITLYKFDQLRIDSIVKLREETANTHPRVEPEECVYELLNLYGMPIYA